jgi:hypothetical protein
MNTPSSIPPIIGPRRTITYEITRWDIFVNWMTVILRNRILQVFVLAMLVINGCLILASSLGRHSLVHLVIEAVIYLIVFVGILAFFQCVLGLANAFIPKHRGVVGRHILELTEQGLIERTDYNETLHRWPSISRVLSLGGYLYIYVSDTNSHQVPKRCFSPQEIDSFEADLRSRTRQTNS